MSRDWPVSEAGKQPKHHTDGKPREHSVGGMFEWKVTRVLFSVGTMAILTGILRIVLDQSQVFPWVLASVGLGLVALSTRGPWDSETSGRIVQFWVSGPARASPLASFDEGTLHQFTERGNDGRRTMGTSHSCRSTPDCLGGYGHSGIGGSVVHRSGHGHRDLHHRAVRTQGTSPESR